MTVRRFQCKSAVSEHAVTVGARPDHNVEGDPPSREFQRFETLVLTPIVVGVALAVLVWMYLIGGILAVLINLVIMSSLYVFGWWPYFWAARLRKQAHED
jgi:hypothetical protein